jgi:pentatricopeptide repeat protein
MDTEEDLRARLEAAVERIQSLQGPENKKVRGRVFKQIGKLKAQLGDGVGGDAQKPSGAKKDKGATKSKVAGADTSTKTAKVKAAAPLLGKEQASELARMVETEEDEPAAKRARNDDDNGEGADAKAKKARLRHVNQQIAASAQRKQLNKALESFGSLQRRGLQADIHTCTNMVNACVRCHEFPLALQFFHYAKDLELDRNVVTYTTLLKGFCTAAEDGMCTLRHAYNLLQDMKGEGLVPNLRTVNTFFRGCARLGSVDEAMEVVGQMQRNWNLEPDFTSYEMIVALLCQNLRLAEARSLVTAATMLLSKQSKKGAPSASPAMFVNLAKASGLLGRWDECDEFLDAADKLLEVQKTTDIKSRMQLKMAAHMSGKGITGGLSGSVSNGNSKRGPSQKGGGREVSKSVQLFGKHRRGELLLEVALIRRFASRMKHGRAPMQLNPAYRRLFVFERGEEEGGAADAPELGGDWWGDETEGMGGDDAQAVLGDDATPEVRKAHTGLLQLRQEARDSGGAAEEEEGSSKKKKSKKSASKSGTDGTDKKKPGGTKGRGAGAAASSGAGQKNGQSSCVVRALESKLGLRKWAEEAVRRAKQQGDTSEGGANMAPQSTPDRYIADLELGKALCPVSGHLLFTHVFNDAPVSRQPKERLTQKMGKSKDKPVLSKQEKKRKRQAAMREEREKAKALSDARKKKVKLVMFGDGGQLGSLARVISAGGAVQSAEQKLMSLTSGKANYVARKGVVQVTKLVEVKKVLDPNDPTLSHHAAARLLQPSQRKRQQVETVATAVALDSEMQGDLLPLPLKLEICSGAGEWAVGRAKREEGHAMWVALELRVDRIYQGWCRMVSAARECSLIVLLCAAQESTGVLSPPLTYSRSTPPPILTGDGKCSQSRRHRRRCRVHPPQILRRAMRLGDSHQPPRAAGMEWGFGRLAGQAHAHAGFLSAHAPGPSARRYSHHRD